MADGGDPVMEMAAGALDHLRSEALRLTMRVEPLREIFRRRSYRLAALFAFSFALSLGTSITYPLWVLALGPIVYGVPHLLASVRYFHYVLRGGRATSGRRTFAILSGALLAIGAYRLGAYHGALQLGGVPLSEWKGSTFVELAALLAAFVGFGWLYRVGWRRIGQGLALLTPLIAGFACDPVATVGALVLVHNFVAFYYWGLSARSPGERSVAWGAGLLTLGTTALIFAGAFDPSVGSGLASETLDFARLSFPALGKLITPWSADSATWRHAAVAYAFGQALHYFVWLKAIPDQQLEHEMPTSFRQSLRLLESDFGRAGARLALIVSLGAPLIWVLQRFSEARITYFALAAFHGYLEIAGLALAGLPSFAIRTGKMGMRIREGT